MPQDSNGKETGWLSKNAFQNGALAADSIGREAVEDGFLTNQMIANTQITASKLAAGVLATGVYGVGLYGTAVYG